MSKLSRRKGHDFERKIARALRKAFPDATVRRGLQSAGAREPDVVVKHEYTHAVDEVWWELSTGRSVRHDKKYEQAKRDVEARDEWWTPVVVWHQYNKRAIWVTLSVEHLTYHMYLQPLPDMYPASETLTTMAFDDFVAILCAAQGCAIGDTNDKSRRR